MKICEFITYEEIVASSFWSYSDFYGKSALFAIWRAVDHFLIIDIETYHPEGKPPYNEISQHCYSRYTYMWVGTSLIYTAALRGALAFVAFKTRKIKWKDFKDTKKINALLFCGCSNHYSSVGNTALMRRCQHVIEQDRSHFALLAGERIKFLQQPNFSQLSLSLSCQTTVTCKCITICYNGH